MGCMFKELPVSSSCIVHFQEELQKLVETEHKRIDEKTAKEKGEKQGEKKRNTSHGSKSEKK